MAESLCQKCAKTSLEPIGAEPYLLSLNRCECGGMRQVVRIFPDRRKSAQPIAHERRQKKV